MVENVSRIELVTSLDGYSMEEVMEFYEWYLDMEKTYKLCQPNAKVVLILYDKDYRKIFKLDDKQTYRNGGVSATMRNAGDGVWQVKGLGEAFRDAAIRLPEYIDIRLEKESA